MINLLPPQQKQELLYEQKYKMLLIISLVLLVFIISLSLSFFSVKTYIAGRAQSEKISVPVPDKDLEEDLQIANQKLKKLELFYIGQTEFSQFLEKISEILPQDIYLTSVSLIAADKKKAKVSLRGLSKTRELLFQLKKQLESDANFKDINFPPSNWVKAENISFSISFQME